MTAREIYAIVLAVYGIFSGFLAELSETGELPADFNEKLFHRLVDYAAIHPDGRVVFIFRNGVEIEYYCVWKFVKSCGIILMLG